MMVMEGLVVDLPGAASGDTRTASSHFAKPVKPSERMMVTVKMGTHSSTHASCTWGYVWMNFEMTRCESYGPCPSWRWEELQHSFHGYSHMHQRLTKSASRTGKSSKRHSNISSFPCTNTLMPWIDWSHANTIRASIQWMSTLMNLKNSLKRLNTRVGLPLLWTFTEALTLPSRLTLCWCWRDIQRKTNLWDQPLDWYVYGSKSGGLDTCSQWSIPSSQDHFDNYCLKLCRCLQGCQRA